MGIGAALGSFVDGYQSAQNNRLAREQAEKKNALADKQIELMDLKVEESKRKQQLLNSPDAKRARAMEMKLKTAQMQYKMNAYNELSGQDTGASEVSQLSQQVLQLKQATDDKDRVDNLKDAYVNYKTTIANGDAITDLKPFNELIASDPVFKTQFPNPVQFYNPTQDSHKQSMTKLAEKVLRLQGIDLTKFKPEDANNLVEQTEYSLEALAKKGSIVVDSETNEAKMLDSMFSITDVANRVSPSITKNANEKVKDLLMNGVQEAHQIQEIRSVPTQGKQLWKGKDPVRYEELLIAAGEKVPTGLKEMIKANAKLSGDQATMHPMLQGKTDTEKLGLIDKIVETSFTGKVDKSYFNLAYEAINTMGDAKDKEAMRARVKNAYARSVTKDVFNGDEPLTVRTSEMFKTMENSNLINSENKNKLRDVKDEVDGNVDSAKNVNEILTEMSGYAEKDQLLTGLFKNTAKDILGKDDAVIGRLNELSGSTDPKDIKEANDLRKAVANTIRVDTKVGMMLAKFIKEMSGAAVSDQEREFLTSVVQGITSGDAHMVGVGLQTFRDVRLRSNEKYYSDDTYQMMLPDTMMNAKRSENLRIEYDIPSTTSVVSRASDMVSGDDSVVSKISDTAGATIDRVKEDAKKSGMDSIGSWVKAFAGGQ